MTNEKRIKQQEIPFILDGQRIVKSVTKNTTCSDVINKLPNLSCPLAVFQSVDGAERELSGKSKLLKVWRAHGPSKKVEFVIRKTNVHTNGRKNGIRLFLNERKCKKTSAKCVQSKGLSQETLKQVSDLARKMPSRAAVNIMGVFLAKADLNEKACCVNFCGTDTAEKVQRQATKSGQNSVMEETIDENILNFNKHMIQYSLTSLKLGLKEKYKTKSIVTRTTSTRTISSTDTGYQSVGSEDMNASGTKTMSQPESGSSLPKRHTFIFSDYLSNSRHSTPIFTSRSRKRRESDIDSTFIGDCTFTSDKLDEGQGKNIILQRFMNDQNIPASSFIGYDVGTTSSVTRQHRDRYSMPVFSNQEEKFRFLWDLYCDSDSDSESETSEPCESLDIAFCAETPIRVTASQARPRTLRRESAISNLNRFSLVSRDNGLDTCTEGTGFDYSFDCSFRRMDESQLKEFSFDFS